MDNPGYVALTRQSGLRREMAVIANNIANISTTGFRRQGVVFSEHVRALGHSEASLSMAQAHARHTSQAQGAVVPTGGQLDLAIEGEGFFTLDTAAGPRLTRAGHFVTDAEGLIVNSDGHRLLDQDGAPVFVPADAHSLSIARDGTVSADGEPLAQLGLVHVPPEDLRHAGGTLMIATQDPEPVENPVILQGFLEDSNVNPILELARMIEVQRAYEMSQSLIEREDQRIKSTIETLGR